MKLTKLRQLDEETVREEVENEVKDETLVNSEPVPLGTVIYC